MNLYHYNYCSLVFMNTTCTFRLDVLFIIYALHALIRYMLEPACNPYNKVNWVFSYIIWFVHLRLEISLVFQLKAILDELIHANSYYSNKYACELYINIRQPSFKQQYSILLPRVTRALQRRRRLAPFRQL